jgi:hypothetical protein
MTEKNENNAKKNEFLEAKMYYYNTDALTERDQVLNSKNAEKLQPPKLEPTVKKIELSAEKKIAATKSKPKTSPMRLKHTQLPNQEKILDRLTGLEDIYKQLAEKLNLSKVSIEVDSAQKTTEKYEDQISQLEQERLTFLEQITTLEEQLVFSGSVEAEKNELKEQVIQLIKEKKDLESVIARLTKEMNDFSQTVSTLENKKSIIYLSKERELLEDKIAVLVQEKREIFLDMQKLTLANETLTKSISELESKVKAVAYLDKKSAMFEEDLRAEETNNHLLTEKLEDAFEKTNKLSKENAALRDNQEMLIKQINNQDDWQQKIDALGLEQKMLIEKNTQLEKEKQDLIHTAQRKNDDPKTAEQKQRLLDRVDQLEEERIHLFKIIGEMEEAQKTAPDITKKNELLQKENEDLKNDNDLVKKQLSDFIKNAKIMQTEIIQLKEKRVFRLELEQEKGKLLKRIKDLEDLVSVYTKQIAGLNQQIAVSQNNNLGLEHLRKEITKLEAQKGELIVQSKEDKAQILKLGESILNENASEQKNKDKIAELFAENKKLLELVKTTPISQPASYILDMEKLAELKEFVLESIQTRRWKSTEFVNGAYDAVGLFYRSILHERPVKPVK